jgi:hypothetical protein
LEPGNIKQQIPQAINRGEIKDKINITNKNNHYKNKIRRIILVVGPLCLTAARREKK